MQALTLTSLLVLVSLVGSAFAWPSPICGLNTGNNFLNQGLTYATTAQYGSPLGDHVWWLELDFPFLVGCTPKATYLNGTLFETYVYGDDGGLLNTTTYHSDGTVYYTQMVYNTYGTPSTWKQYNKQTDDLIHSKAFLYDTTHSLIVVNDWATHSTVQYIYGVYGFDPAEIFNSDGTEQVYKYTYTHPSGAVTRVDETINNVNGPVSIQSTQFTYNSHSDLETSVLMDGAGRVEKKTSYSYDTYNRLAAALTEEPQTGLQRFITFAYNGFGLQAVNVKVTDPNGSSTTSFAFQY